MIENIVNALLQSFLRSRLRRCRAGICAIALACGMSGCDVFWDVQSALPFFGLPVAWMDPADVSAASRASGPFGVAISLPLEPRVQTAVAGAIVAPDEVVTYQVGAMAAGDLLSVEVVAQDRGFDPAVAVFDAELNVIHLNDDRDYFARATDPALHFAVRRPTHECYVVVSASVRSDSAGGYHLRVTWIPGEKVPQPQPQVVYLDFDGATNAAVGGRTIAQVPAFAGELIDPVFADATDALRGLTVARIRADFAAYDVTIVSSSEEAPPAGPYSTIYFGSYSSMLLGLADSVDTFNAYAVQRAIVFVDTFSVFMSQAPSVEEMADALANVASHEIGHLLGLHHTRDPQDIMDTSATLRQMLRGQYFLRAPLNGDTFAVGFQDSRQTLISNVGGDEHAAYAQEHALRSAKGVDPWYDAAPSLPARELMRFGTACGGH